MMDLSRNKLSGNIPNQIGQMVALEVLDLSSNQLNGTVPKEIGQCLGLQSVKLNNNSLSGSLPGSIGNLIHPTLLQVCGACPYLMFPSTI